MNEKKPDNWDWVTARGKCSVTVMFAELINMARMNVQQRLAAGTDEEQKRERFFVNVQNGDRFFTVNDRWTHLGDQRSVSFALRGDEIFVRSNFQQGETAYTLSLNDDGECRLMTGGQQKAPWQVMRHAIESLLFSAHSRRRCSMR